MDLYDEMMKRRQEEAARKAEQARLEISPARRMLPNNEEQLRAALQPKPAPEPVLAPDPKTHEAERMKLQPPGLQRAPSPGGGNYVNSLAYKPQPETTTEKPAVEKTSGQENLFDKAKRRADELRARAKEEERPRPIERLYPDLTRSR